MSERRRPAREPERRPAGEDFIDINSRSDGGSTREDWFALRESTKRERASAERSRQSRERERSGRERESRGREADQKRRSRSNAAQPRGRPSQGRERTSQGRDTRQRGAPMGSQRPPRQTQERKRRKPMSLFRRRLLIVLGVLVMLLGTAFLAESLLLRVTAVRVTGDMIYPEEEILRICGYKTGDNLLFVPDRENQLKAVMPYIAKAKLVKKIPGTIEINITAAQAVCCLQAGGTWLTLDGEGRVLEAGTEAKQGLLQVNGLNPTGYNIGVKLDLGQEDTAAAFAEILRVIDGLQAGQGFTRLDLSDLHDIRLWYQDRVECRLGSTAELEHKILYGYGLFDNEREDGIKDGETGVLELSYLPERKRAFFEEGSVTPGVGQANPPIQAQATTAPDDAGNGDDGNNGDGQNGDDDGGDGSGGRGGDIPDDIFTG